MNNRRNVDFDQNLYMLFVRLEKPVLVKIEEQQRIFKLNSKYGGIENISNEETIKVSPMSFDKSKDSWVMSEALWVNVPVNELKVGWVKLG